MFSGERRLTLRNVFSYHVFSLLSRRVFRYNFIYKLGYKHGALCSASTSCVLAGIYADVRCHTVQVLLATVPVFHLHPCSPQGLARTVVCLSLPPVRAWRRDCRRLRRMGAMGSRPLEMCFGSRSQIDQLLGTAKLSGFLTQSLHTAFSLTLAAGIRFSTTL